MYAGDAASKSQAHKNEVESLGLTLEDIPYPAEIDPEAVIEVWPENVQAYMVFDALSTQWRVGMNGATGLDYNVLPEIWRRTKTPVADRDDVFRCLQVMENAALEMMSEQQAANKK